MYERITYPRSRYCVRTGVYRLYDQALEQQLILHYMAHETMIIRQGALYVLYAGNCLSLDEAAELEQMLKYCGYDTMITSFFPDSC